MHVARGFAFLALVVSVLGCSEPPPYEYVAGEDPEFPRLRVADREVSVNDRCPVTLSRLNRRIDPVYVNGRAIGFC